MCCIVLQYCNISDDNSFHRFASSSQEVRKMEKERAAHRTRCQKAVTEVQRVETTSRTDQKRREVKLGTLGYFGILLAEFPVFCLDMPRFSHELSEALRLLNDHQKACKESSHELKLIRPLVHQYCLLRLRDPFSVPSPTHTL